MEELSVDAAEDASALDWPTRARAALDGAADAILDYVRGQFGSAALQLTADGGRFSATGGDRGSVSTGTGGEGAQSW